MNNLLPTFEEILFPLKLRRQYALGNVHADVSSCLASAGVYHNLPTVATKCYGNYNEEKPARRIGFVTLFAPVGCNAS